MMMLMSRDDDSKEEPVRFWQVSPGKKERGFWPRFKSDNIIGMGWDDLGDLGRFTSKNDIENALKRTYVYPEGSSPINHVNSIWIFFQLIKKGHIIVAKKGASKEIYGIGRVLREYHFAEDRERFKHVIDVDWIIGFDERVKVETSKQFVQWTAHSLSASRFGEIRQSILNKYPDLNERFGQLLEGPKRARAEKNRVTSPQIRDKFLLILANYLAAKSDPNVRTRVKDTFQSLQIAFRNVPTVSRRENINVSYSMGIGRMADVPWLLLSDRRETDTAQSGVYCVYLFKTDMSGVYLTFNQGIGLGVKTRPSKVDLERLHSRAVEIRRDFTWLSEHGFSLDDNIVLARSGTGKSYEKSTIAHKYYDRNQFPSEGRIVSDLDHILNAYERYVTGSTPPPAPMPPNLQPSSIKTKLMIDEVILEQVCANLNSGNHLIITGPVGTGKTSLSEDICHAAKEDNFCGGYVLTTASSDWTTFDTIGGYMPTEGGKLRFEQGKFLEAIRENKWLIIDEINRADIDKAFGQLFTVLSGQRVELPFKHSNGKTISIEPTIENKSYFDHSEAAYKVGKNWRIIATMNVYDMNFLFEMSYAFMRRFAFVYLDVPERFEELIDKWCGEKTISDGTKEKLKELTKLTERKMGPAIIRDMVEYIEYRGDGERELAEAIVAYIVPQLAGLEREKIKKTWDQIGKIFDEKGIPNGIIRPILRQIVGIEFEEISE